jgi:hypothetical protein
MEDRPSPPIEAGSCQKEGGFRDEIVRDAQKQDFSFGRGLDGASGRFSSALCATAQ